MSNRARRITVEEFFYCYRPSKITQSKGMYSFVPKSLLLRLVCDTPDLNRNWKSRYFFIQGDDWMCHPGDQEYMPVDKTWGVMPLFGMRSSILGFNFLLFILFDILTFSYYSSRLSKSHPRGVELLGEDLHDYQAIGEVVD